MAEKTATIPERSQVPKEDQWNLDSLFPSPEAWEEGLVELKEKTQCISQFQGRLSESAEVLKECLTFRASHLLLAETVKSYAYLKYSENLGDSAAVDRQDRCDSALSDLEVAWTFLRDEVLAIAPATMEEFLREPSLEEHKIFLNRLLRRRPHTLSDKEETILAKQTKLLQTPKQAFSALTNVDMDFGTVTTSEGEVPLTATTLGLLLKNKDREVRRRAYQQFCGVYEAHKNTLAALYSGRVQQNIFLAKVRNFPSARAAALFPDNVDEAVYDNLITTVTEFLPTTLHRYLALRKARLGYEKIFSYDRTVPLVDIPKCSYPYDEATQEVVAALAPLGPEYVSTLREGLLNKGWVDRYENKGKCSGAFSSANGYQGEPYILLNYKEDDFRWIFTLAHEVGHSVQTWYAVRHNPFQHYHASIFEAEVTSTLNEELLFAYFVNRSTDSTFLAHLITEYIDNLVGTLFRQTQFAEYELTTHRLLEEGRPLTVEVLREEYRKLFEKYGGGVLEFSESDDLVGLRIPHFYIYDPFYVYQYATGISAAIALAKGLLQDDNHSARENYLSFLKSGGSRFPIDALKVAGVDLSGPQPIREALTHVSELITTLEALLKEC